MGDDEGEVADYMSHAFLAQNRQTNEPPRDNTKPHKVIDVIDVMCMMYWALVETPLDKSNIGSSVTALTHMPYEHGHDQDPLGCGGLHTLRFKMLSKMGYKAGQGVGKAQVDNTEATRLVFRDKGQAIGVKSKAEKRQEFAAKFKQTLRAGREERTARGDLKRALTACWQMDEEASCEDTPFPRPPPPPPPDPTLVEQPPAPLAIWNAIPPEELWTQLDSVVEYLRDQHRIFDSPEELSKQCPGPSREDHDDDEV
eukprot:gene8080-1443_t